MVLSRKVVEYMWNILPPNLTGEVKCCGWGIYSLRMYLSFLFSYIGIAAPLTPSHNITLHQKYQWKRVMTPGTLLICYFCLVITFHLCK